MIQIFDEFLSTYGELREYATSASYSGEVNPVDKVEYPNINSDIPINVRDELLGRIEELLGRAPEKVTMFLRMSPEGVYVPHMAHHDLSMGKYSLMLYLNDHPEGGTALLRHRQSGMAWAPENPAFAYIAQGDQNNAAAWATIQIASMKQNRAAIFDAAQFHCALPMGGFGETPSDARIVLTAFFS